MGFPAFTGETHLLLPLAEPGLVCLSGLINALIARDPHFKRRQCLILGQDGAATAVAQLMWADDNRLSKLRAADYLNCGMFVLLLCVCVSVHL